MTEGQNASPARRFFGWMLTVLGGLWVLLTGGCTLTLTGIMASEMGGNFTDDARMLLVYLALGAVFVAPGAGLLIWGLALLRRRRTGS